MANLGNCWHIPNDPEPVGQIGMRVPAADFIATGSLTIFNGNQWFGNGNPGNQLEDGSSIIFKRSTDPNWSATGLTFDSQNGNDKFFVGAIPLGNFNPGDVIQYYLRIMYSDHDTTFLSADGVVSATTADEATAQASPFTVTKASTSEAGEWSAVIPLTNVPIHAHLSPKDGKVIYWGRRGEPRSMTFATLNDHFTKAYIFDPATQKDVETGNQPADSKGNSINHFCSSHTFLADGRLMVVGGHLFDTCGIKQTSIYDPFKDQWSAAPEMENGRWYPTAVTLPDGRVMAFSGTFAPNPGPPNANPDMTRNETPEIWADGDVWKNEQPFTVTNNVLPFYPRMHVAPDDRIFMSGALAPSFFFDPIGNSWSQSPATRQNGFLEYAASVMYEPGKIIYIGGGGGGGDNGVSPRSASDTIDLNVPGSNWIPTGSMNFRRRQHNATILPDGSVLVTGGTQGSGGMTNGFNDLRPGNPIHAAELWDPTSGQWTVLAEETNDRCYHSTAVLLLDGTVFSGGGGEYQPVTGSAPQDLVPNDPSETKTDCQIFSPPYLFKGDRPVIDSCPGEVQYGSTFEVGTSNPGDIQKVSLIHISSVTHSFNTSQRIVFLDFTIAANSLTVTAPTGSNICPPGHYMVFILNKAGVPSVAKIVKLEPKEVAAAIASAATAQANLISVDSVSLKQKDAEMAAQANKLGLPTIQVGLTATCTYGLQACYSGARGALRNLFGVWDVQYLADRNLWVARLFLDDEAKISAIPTWRDQFVRATNGSYGWRGLEITLTGAVQEQGGATVLVTGKTQDRILLAPLNPKDIVQCDPSNNKEPLPATEEELNAFQRLRDEATQNPGRAWSITGPITESNGQMILEIRQFSTSEIPGALGGSSASAVQSPERKSNRRIRSILHARIGETTNQKVTPPVVAGQPKGLAPGFTSNPANDLAFNGGHTIQDLSYRNFFVGNWDETDVANIDHALAAVMQDPGMNDILSQYFAGGEVKTTVIPSGRLKTFGGAKVNKTDVENLVTSLHADGTLGAANFDATVFNFMLPKGIFLTSDDAAGHEEEADKEVETGAGLTRPQEDDADDSGAGLGGYHGSVDIPGATRVYYAVGVFSEVQANGTSNGIPVFSDSWKNVVATFYHELTEARTDPDVEVGNATNDLSKFGWVASNGEIGDIPIDLAANIQLVIKEIQLANGEIAPVQLMYSNRVHGPEEP